jgi:Tol biopolymer transport system component
MGKISPRNQVGAGGVLVILLCTGLSGCNAEEVPQHTREAPTQQTALATEQPTASETSLPPTEQPTRHPCLVYTLYPRLIWSPDGSKLAYGASPSGGYDDGDVYIIDIDTGVQTHLVDYTSGGYPHVWSPDGSRILLLGDASMRIIDSDGTNLTDISHADYHGATWSPDSTNLAYIEWNGTAYQLSILELDSGTSSPIYIAPPSTTDLRNPLWSPDGKRITFIISDSDVSQEAMLMVINADGTQPVQLAHIGPDNPYTYWSPDSQKLAFSNPMGAYTGAYAVNADGTSLIKITDYPAYSAAWLPDGTGVVILIETKHPPGLEFHISQIDLDGTMTILSDYEGCCATFSPDAAKVASISDKGFRDIYVMNVDGTNKTRLPIKPGDPTCYD